MIVRTVVYTTVVLVVLSLNQVFALDCPKFPEQAKKDWEVKVTAEVLKLGPLKGIELKTTTRNATRDLFANLPDAGRVYLEQMMLAAYCSSLRDDKTLTDTEKSKRLNDYIREVRRTITAAETSKKANKKPLQKDPASEKSKNQPSGSSEEKNVVVSSQGQSGGITAHTVININEAPLKAQSWGELYEELERKRIKDTDEAIVTRIFWLTRDPGASISLRPCPGEKCFEFVLGELKTSDGALVQTIILKGDGFGVKRRPQSKYLLEMNNPIRVKGAQLVMGLYDNYLAVNMGLHRDSTFEMFASHANIKFTVVDILSDSLRIKLEVSPPNRTSLPPDFHKAGTRSEKESNQKATGGGSP